jgi:transcriptional regulator with XRE-family HTH domain
MEKDEELTKLGLRIKELRKMKNVTQEELAHVIDKDQQSIQRLEAGISSRSPKAWGCRLAKFSLSYNYAVNKPP